MFTIGGQFAAAEPFPRGFGSALFDLRNQRNLWIFHLRDLG